MTTTTGRHLWVLGGSPGSIGFAVWTRLTVDAPHRWDSVNRWGIEDFDASDQREMQEAMEGGRPTDVVFSVGINRLEWSGRVLLHDFRTVMETNVYSFLNLLRSLENTGDTPVNIVAITSDAAWRPMRTSAVYCASKAALEMTVRVASREYAPKGWRINGVAPGKVAGTPMTNYVDWAIPQIRGWSPEFAEEYERNSSPLGRAVTKGEVAEVVASVLYGPDAQTGEIIAVNGGR